MCMADLDAGQRACAFFRARRSVVGCFGFPPDGTNDVLREPRGDVSSYLAGWFTRSFAAATNRADICVGRSACVARTLLSACSCATKAIPATDTRHTIAVNCRIRT